MIHDITLNFKNCFGIKSLNHTFSFDKCRTHLIYAPNGSMKSSLAKTMRYFSGQSTKEPKDFIFRDREPCYEVEVDSTKLTPPYNKIFVFNGEDDIDSSKSFVNFLASADLKQEYEAIYTLLNKEKDALMTKLKTISQSTDCEKEILDAFSNNPNDTIFSVLEQISSFNTDQYALYEFRYNDIFDAKGKVREFINKHKDALEQYFDDYLDLLRNSTLYRVVDGHIFGTHHVNQLLKYVEDGNFFGVNHKLVLQDGTEFKSYYDLSDFVQKEKDRILKDEKLRKAFEKITKAIDNNSELRNFKTVLETHPEWVPSILDYDHFKQVVWLGFIYSDEIKDSYNSYMYVYSGVKDKLVRILQTAESQQTTWKRIIDLYNTRFHVPLKVSILNQKDIILKQQAAKLSFSYVDGESSVETDKKVLTEDVLSRGEKRAFFILQFLFEIESRKSTTADTILVLDDVADSFDYQNKFAIIEYIRDLKNTPYFYLLIFTHNYDFYRSVSVRLPLGGKNLWMAERSSDGNIQLLSGMYRGDVYSNAFVGHEDKDEIFISMIPFVRNLIEYTQGTKSEDYLKLTSCLHRKDDTDTITEQNVVNIIEKFNKGKALNRKANATPWYDLVISTADKISSSNNINPILLENKIVLSIAIRLLMENFLYKKFIQDNIDKDEIKVSRNQLGEWTNLFRRKYPNDTRLMLIERVNMMTPEFIHINSFMFEPLIDMSVQHLIDLYKEVKLIAEPNVV